MTPSRKVPTHKGGAGAFACEARSSRLLLALAAVGAVALLMMALANRDSWDVDFNQYYSAGRLAGTGHLYDWTALQALEHEHGSKVIPFFRLPVYAAICKSLTLLPYAQSRIVFFLLELGAVVGFVILWPLRPRDRAWAAICWSVPLALGLAFGQDPVIFLFFVALGFRLLRDDHDFAAGLIFSLCASKIHLAILIPVVLAARGRWKALSGGALGGCVLVAASFAVEGWTWPQRFLEATHLPEFDPASNRMPNLRGLLGLFGAGLGIEIIIAVTVAVAVFLLSRKLPFRSSMALALSAGLLLSHHAYVYDCVLLLPAILLGFEEETAAWLRIWALGLCTPVPYLLIMTNLEVPGHLAISGYTLAFLATLLVRHFSTRPSASDVSNAAAYFTRQS